MGRAQTLEGWERLVEVEIELLREVRWFCTLHWARCNWRAGRDRQDCQRVVLDLWAFAKVWMNFENSHASSIPALYAIGSLSMDV